MRQDQKRRWHFSSVLVVWLLAIGGLAMPAAMASPPANNVSGNVTQSYTAGSSIENGMLVELKSGSSQTVVPLPSRDLAHILGVTVPAANAAIVLTPIDSTGQQVLVATSGHYDVLVSNQNGAINSGDYITISSLDGIGMVANKSDLEVVGQAEAGFNGNSNVLSTVQTKDNQGHSVNMAIGSIPVSIDVMANPLYQLNPALVPGFLSQLASGVAGRPLTAARVYVAMAVLAATVFIAASIMYGTIRGGMVALGRNPLSRQPIVRGLRLSLTMVVIIFTVGVFAVYLLLKL